MTHSLYDHLHATLSEKFTPDYLQIIDETHKHKNHMNTPYDKETHFSIFIVSSAFQLMSRLERHRAIMDLFKENLKDQLHALAIKAFTPSEYQKFLKTTIAS